MQASTGLACFKIRLFAADDESERARRRTGHAPGRRGIEKTDAARLAAAPHLTGRGRPWWSSR